jgi:hypothetical protein
MSLADAFAPVEAKYRAQVIAATWGHLAPEPQRLYRARVIFTCAAYSGTYSIINAKLDVPDSPWLFDHLIELAMRKARDGRVSVFEGTYRITKTGRGIWKGTTRVVRI